MKDDVDPQALFKMLVVLVAHLQNRQVADVEELAAMLRAATGDDEFDFQLHALADAIDPTTPSLSLIDGGKSDDEP
jgi:hypothetical protein